MLNQQGFVAECTADNIFIVKNDTVITPNIADGALGGITRRLMFDLAREMGRSIREANVTRYDLFVADELFLTGTGAEVVPINEVDGRKIGGGRVGPVTEGVHPAFPAADAKYRRSHLLILDYIVFRLNGRGDHYDLRSLPN